MSENSESKNSRQNILLRLSSGPTRCVIGYLTIEDLVQLHSGSSSSRGRLNQVFEERHAEFIDNAQDSGPMHITQQGHCKYKME
jgi:hypothetical protein